MSCPNCAIYIHTIRALEQALKELTGTYPPTFPGPKKQRPGYETQEKPVALALWDFPRLKK